ncbi:MAG: MvaI/BcnI family restriction endonuclease [Sphingomicrobium sp.]
MRTIPELQQLFARHGVRTLYIKHLAPKQDNEKNQIYLGKGLDGVLNLFPARIVERSASESTAKPKSRTGKPKLEGLIELAWLQEGGALARVPGARIIDYFQYPEARLSGFLAGCEAAPRALRRDGLSDFGRRILVLGTTPSGLVVGKVLTERDDPLVRDFPELPVLAAVPVFRVLSVAGAAGVSPLQLLLGELRQIVSAGWHASVILKPGASSPVPFSGNQGAGYTLEALLGVAANAAKEPDAHGYEIKSYRGDRISLMTPTPDGGYQGEHSFREFMERYGREAKKADGSRRFTGLHRVGSVSATTGLGLRVRGYDPHADSFDADGIAVEMFDPETGTVAASWSLERLANSWNAKHASAMYVPAEARETADGEAQYRYGSEVLVGEGTDVFRLLRAIHRGLVWYDPADSIYADGTAKVRPQWRTGSRRLEQTMHTLYRSARQVRI